MSGMYNSIYRVDSKKQKIAQKQLVKSNLTSAKGFVRFCYGATWFLRILAVVLGILNIIGVALSGRVAFLIVLIPSFGFTYLLSLLPQTVYVVSCSGDYSFRSNETILAKSDGFIYSYHDLRSDIPTEQIVFNVDFNMIERMEYDAVTGMITIWGHIEQEVYYGAALVQEDIWECITFLNAYEADVADIVKKEINRRQE